MAELRVRVGDHEFSTTRRTLCAYPNSMLSAMFDESSGFRRDAHFIDRDGRHFHHVLNYLRNGLRPVSLPSDEAALRELQAEADFYGLSELSRLLQDRLRRAASGVYQLMEFDSKQLFQQYLTASRRRGCELITSHASGQRYAALVLGPPPKRARTLGPRASAPAAGGAAGSEPADVGGGG